MSKELFTSPVNALEEKALGPWPGRGRREQSRVSRPPAEKITPPSRSYLVCKAKRIIQVFNMQSLGSHRLKTWFPIFTKV